MAATLLRKRRPGAYIHDETEGKPHQVPVVQGVSRTSPPTQLFSRLITTLPQETQTLEVCCFIEPSPGTAADFAFSHGLLSSIEITLMGQEPLGGGIAGEEPLEVNSNASTCSICSAVASGCSAATPWHFEAVGAHLLNQDLESRALAHQQQHGFTVLSTTRKRSKNKSTL